MLDSIPFEFINIFILTKSIPFGTSKQKTLGQSFLYIIKYGDKLSDEIYEGIKIYIQLLSKIVF